MTDRTGREIDYLRVSVTDRCNLRCVYCMPAQGVEAVPYDQLLTLEDVPRPDHAADALAAAVCYVTHEGCSQAEGRYGAAVARACAADDRRREAARTSSERMTA